MPLSDIDRRDKCLKPEGELILGGLALVVRGPEEFHGMMVRLVGNAEGLWEVLDGNEDLLLMEGSDLMPISKPDWDNKTDLDKFIYEARYGS